jgi:hypothetical protein
VKTTMAGSADPATTTAVTVPRQYDGEQLDLITLLCGPATVAERFRAFHEANPHVYEALVGLTREYVRRTGRRTVGIAAVYEAARWELSLQTTEEQPRLNNSFRSYYSRLIMALEPDLEGVFPTRSSAADVSVTRQARE